MKLEGWISRLTRGGKEIAGPARVKETVNATYVTREDRELGSHGWTMTVIVVRMRGIAA